MASIHDRATFVALRRDGIRRRSGPVTVTALVGRDEPSARVAYALSRAVGNAVTRNRLRRRLRAIVQTLPLAPGAYLISASASAADLGPDDLTAHVTRAVTAAASA